MKARIFGASGAPNIVQKDKQSFQMASLSMMTIQS
jgi:hypothetical protein